VNTQELDLALAAHEAKTKLPQDVWDALRMALAAFAARRVMSLTAAPQDSILQAQGRAQQANEIAEIFNQCTEKARQHMVNERK
jgi:hypothetical protein